MKIENLRKLLSTAGFLSAVRAVTECLKHAKNTESRQGGRGIDDNCLFEKGRHEKTSGLTGLYNY